MSATEPRSFTVTGASRRLDKFLADMLQPQGVSREKIKRLIQAGHARINGSVCVYPSERVFPGARVNLAVPEPEPGLRPEPGAVQILYQDACLLAVNKPAGLTVHPCPSCPSGTLLHRLAHHFPELGRMEGTRPGVVHRLDKDTSGVMLVALDEQTRLALSRDFAERKVVKEYVAVLKGVPREPEAEIAVPIGRHPTSKVKMAAFPDLRDPLPSTVRHARTRYKVAYADPSGLFSVALVRIYTGRTHQIRVHMAHAGHPLWGDYLYGGPTHLSREGQPLRLIPDTEAPDPEMELETGLAGADIPEGAPAPERWESGENSFSRDAPRKHFTQVPEGARLVAARQLLHAVRIGFRQPHTGETREALAPLPQDFLDGLAQLQNGPLRVVLTGLPGSGKSAAARLLARFGAPVWSADECVRRLYARGQDGWHVLRARYGERFTPDGAQGVDKAALFAAMREDGRIRHEVERLIHPLVEHELQAFWEGRVHGHAKNAEKAETRYRIAEVPLFLETQKPPYPQAIVTGVYCPAAIRHERLRARSGLPAAAAALLDAWQWPEARKLRACSLILDNSGDMAALEDHTRALHEVLCATHARQSRGRVWEALAGLPRAAVSLDALSGPEEA